MAMKRTCDGCGATLYRKDENPPVGGFLLTVCGSRVVGVPGPGLPVDHFDWCLRCAQAAFQAVADRQFQDTGLIN